jgi:predicted nucleic acid-binding protein
MGEVIDYVFVDTNIFLSLFSFAEDDLQQLRKIFIISNEGGIKFIITQQVVDEYYRNRDAKVSEALKPLRDFQLAPIPLLARDLEEFKVVSDAQDQLRSARKALMDKVNGLAALRNLAADKLVGEIFSKSKIIPVTDEIVAKAQRRVLVGNPPGKNGSLGDAINWECILASLEIFDLVHFVSLDKDYRSPLSDSEFNDFLVRELTSTHFGEVKFYPSLKAFLKAHFPDAKIEAFEATGSLISNLASSESFSTTHACIAELSLVQTFTAKQIDRLISAAEQNNQVKWILSDGDLAEFYGDLRKKYGKILSKGQLTRLNTIMTLAKPDAEEDESPPF